MHAFLSFFAGSIFLLSGCTRGLDGAPCPCAPGYECCVAQNACYRLDQSCPADGAGGRAPLSSGGRSGESSGGNAGAGAGNSVAGGQGVAGSPSAVAGGGGSLELGGGAGVAGATNEPVFALVPTQHNDNARTGSNLNERALTVAAVDANFGQLSRRPVRGAVFAQPLVAPRVKRPAGEELDLVYLATMANVVYAFDARHPERPPIWTHPLGPSIVLPDPLIANGSGQIWHEIGVLGTPVLSIADGAMYVVAATKQGDTYAHKLYKLELSTGNELASADIVNVGFVNAKHAQRSALTLAKGVLYVPFGDYNPSSDADGWVFTFDVDLSPLGVIRLGNPSGLGVTMSGQGAAADESGSVFLSTGSGSLSADAPPAASASRVLAIPDPTGAGLRELFSCSSAGQCPSSELGSSGPLLLPNTDQLVVAGQRHLYLFSRGARASAASAPSLLQKFRGNGSLACDPSSGVSCAAMPSSPAYWPGAGPQPKPRLFAWAPSDRLRSFAYDPNAGRFDCLYPASDNSCSTPVSALHDSEDANQQTPQSGAHLSVSSRGSEPGTGIVWAAHPYTTDGLRSRDGILRAFNAEDLSLTWSTEDAGTPLGPLAPGATPTVSGGRVFMGTADGISKKKTLYEESTSATPAVANSADELLILAWAVHEPAYSGFKVAWALDAFHFSQPSSVFDSLFALEPALAADGSHFYLGWTASTPPTRTVKVAVSADPSFAQMDFMTLHTDSATSVPLSSSAISAPALAYGNHRLFLAFHDEYQIVVLSSQDGSSFDAATRAVIPVGYSSYNAPALSYLNGKLYLMSTDHAAQMNVFVSTDEGAHFSNPTRVPVSSVGPAALLMFDAQGTGQPDLHLVWTDTPYAADPDRIRIGAVIDGDFSRLARIQRFEADQAHFGVSAARFKDAWYVAWMGVGVGYPNVARYSPGELVSYGLRGPQ